MTADAPVGHHLGVAIVRTSDAGAVRTISLDRPERLNALGREMREALEDAVRDAAEADVRVVVLRGAGRSFSAGADLKDLDAPPPDANYAERRRASGRWGRLLDAIEALPQPTVAYLHGHAIGGAALLALACDLRVAAPDLALSIPELAIGIPLTWGGVPRLVREIGLPRARELVMTGRALGAEEALDWCLVHRIGAEEALEGLISELLAMPPGPLAVTKDAFRAYGRTLVSLDAAWADPDLLDAARRDPGAAEAGAEYLGRRGLGAEEEP